MQRYVMLPPWVILTQMFFGLGWLRAAVAKGVSDQWWGGETITVFSTSHIDHALPWAVPIIRHLIIPHAPSVAVIIFAGQLFTGLALTSHKLVRPALWVGIALNIAFIAAGAVNPSAFYVVGQASLLLWISTRQHLLGQAASRSHLFVISGCILLGIFHLPLITTIDPSRVIEDPAIMIAMLGLMAPACYITSSPKSLVETSEPQARRI